MLDVSETLKLLKAVKPDRWSAPNKKHLTTTVFSRPINLFLVTELFKMLKRTKVKEVGFCATDSVVKIYSNEHRFSYHFTVLPNDTKEL